MVRLGIIGTGMMACIIAESCSEAGIKLHSVLSRTAASSENSVSNTALLMTEDLLVAKIFF